MDGVFRSGNKTRDDVPSHLVVGKDVPGDLADLYAKTEHPFLEALLRHRDATRLRVTVEGLIKSVADDGRIHTTYVQNIAATGRLSIGLTAVVAVLLCAQGFVHSVHVDRVLSRDDTRALTRDWMVRNVPPGTKVVIEPVVPDAWARDRNAARNRAALASGSTGSSSTLSLIHISEPTRPY